MPMKFWLWRLNIPLEVKVYQVGEFSTDGIESPNADGKNV